LSAKAAGVVKQKPPMEILYVDDLLYVGDLLYADEKYPPGQGIGKVLYHSSGLIPNSSLSRKSKMDWALVSLDPNIPISTNKIPSSSLTDFELWIPNGIIKYDVKEDEIITQIAPPSPFDFELDPELEKQWVTAYFNDGQGNGHPETEVLGHTLLGLEAAFFTSERDLGCMVWNAKKEMVGIVGGMCHENGHSYILRIGDVLDDLWKMTGAKASLIGSETCPSRQEWFDSVIEVGKCRSSGI